MVSTARELQRRDRVIFEEESKEKKGKEDEHEEEQEHEEIPRLMRGEEVEETSA